jgi:molecular chaperone HscB
LFGAIVEARRFARGGEPMAQAADYFAILGVERRYHVALDELERRFHERSKLHHPDRHAQSDPQTRVKSALAATELNQAYRTLRSDISRAEYLLKLEGITISDERSGHKVSPAFLMEIMELREALMDARGEGDADKVRALAADVRARHEKGVAQIGAAFTNYEAASDDAARKTALTTAADALVAERYFRRFLDEVEAFEEQLEERGSP